ncbi:methanogenesis marker 8 protein [Methanoplanus limicola]|uniref:Methanogenesis marker protein 8 n=1 Tax=Methanoplanus limicola DSM 2279 TaxID=937775 RepID=H1YXT1_9EURY|nr:methanogenesis marker 8 protein [Methanoplanus limicola]EHQ35930.1 methanogenesis marker protein 8 [Methanoplanus limicola DSM 2279]
MKDEHIIEAAGMARVTVSNGLVVSVEEPLLKSCPLARKFGHPVTKMEIPEIKRNIEERISSFGMCTPEREVISDDDFVLFGASELLSNGLRSGIIDCAVIACDGAGSVVCDNPLLVQGIGGRMSGLVKTVPYRQVIERIEKSGGIVTDRESASVDPLSALKTAVNSGYKKPAVTVASAVLSEKIRSECPEAVIVAVHTTGILPEDAEVLSDNCDLISACASLPLRNIAGKRALLQAGNSVPVYAMTKTGKEIIFDKLMNSDQQVFVKGMKLPYMAGKDPEPLI